MKPLSVLAVLVGGVEDDQVLISDVGSAFDGLPATDVVVGLGDLFTAESERLEQVEVPRGVLVGLKAETLEGGFSEDEHVEGVFQVEHRRQDGLDLVDLLGGETLFPEGCAV